jgi:hypothetical protein
MNPNRALLVAALTLATAAPGVSQPATPRQTTVAPRSRMLPGTRFNALGTVQGNALNATNGQLPNTLVRLRDARFGRIVDTQLTDRVGLFAFRNVEPGTYVVEMIGGDRATVLAASHVLNVSGGEAVSALVQLPFRIAPYANVLGNSAPSITAVTTEAAASTVMAVTTAGEPTCPTGPIR